MDGLITDIQRFSLHDGPGIRTTVFLQGCNMTCDWCHNPETISRKPTLMYYKNNCIRCGQCLTACPQAVLDREGDEIRIERSACIGCGVCTKVCFAGALVMSGKKIKVDALLDEIGQDDDYYRNSGGGVTVSGGEVLVQPDFVMELLTRCKKQGIATAIETNLNASWDKVEKMLPLTDLVMCDIKHMDEEKHREWTGVSNKRVIENISKLAEASIPMIIRTPVIPLVNQTEEEIAAIAGYIHSVGGKLLYYELLNFNPLGDAKYQGLAKENRFCHQRPATKSTMEKLAQAASNQGIPVKI